jgi:thiamine biosynthesis protein ThiS
LKAHGFNPEQSGFAVAINEVVARRTEWDVIQLQPGDRVEIIQAAAGG